MDDFLVGLWFWANVWLHGFISTARTIASGKKLSRTDLRRIAKRPGTIDSELGINRYPLNIDPKDIEFAKKIFKRYGTPLIFGYKPKGDDLMITDHPFRLGNSLRFGEDWILFHRQRFCQYPFYRQI